MAFVVADRVKETTTTAGTGTITLAGAATGFQSFSVIGNGNTTFYTIAGQGTSEWEVGIGTYTSSGTTLSRDTVLSSSSGGTKVSFSAGTKDVFVTYPAGRSVFTNPANTFTAAQTFRATDAVRSEAASTQDAVVLAGRAGGTSSYAVTLTPTTLSGNRTLTLPDASGTILQSGTAVTVAQGGTGITSGTSGGIPYFSSTSAIASSGLLSANQFVIGGGAGASPTSTTTISWSNTFTAAQTFRAANAVRSEAASTQDAVVLAGRAGGTSSYAVTLTPTTLSANRTLTLPDASGTILQSGTAVTVPQGGTGLTTTTAYALIAAGTTSTGNFQQVSGLGTSGQVLTSNGAGALPTWGNVSGTLSWQSVQAADFTAVAGRAYPCNTTSGLIVATLPASPSAGQIVTFTDYAGTCGTNPVGIERNGSNINGAASNTVLNVNRGSINLVYVDVTQGWVSYAGWAQTSLPPAAPSTVSYLVIGGGGAGGNNRGGGGGAGGYRAGTLSVSTGVALTVTVGAGGTAQGSTASASSGSNSVFSTITSAGGGGGGGFSPAGSYAGASGGSGGGGGYSNTSAGAGNTPSASPSQGNSGGAGDSGNLRGGGGGGASAAGAAAGAAGGAGGNGTASSISGSSVTRAGGGGGYTSGAGGSGGGGTGAGNGGPAATSGSANTGSGGGGGQEFGNTLAGNGGSGVVIISYNSFYPAATTTGSPTVTTSGGNRIYTWTGNGSITF